MKIGLVLEGGGMRGLYTAGALDAMLDCSLSFDAVIGVSAGACNGVSFVSGQRGRNARINLGYAADDRYVSVRNLFRCRSMFGMDFIFDEIPARLVPFDYAAFQASPVSFTAVCTDVLTGNAAYFGKEHIRDSSVVLRASSSIPCFAPMVEYQGRKYLDGGASDPIPVQRALDEGCERVVVVLTRERGYRKQPERFRAVYRRVFREYPCMTAALDERAGRYNASLDLLEALEREGRALVLAPREPLGLSRFERDVDKLREAYEKGLADASRAAEAIRALRARMAD